MHIYCDFDGTISIKDTTDEILSQFASPIWEMIEEEWKNGEIGSAECMREQIALITASREKLDAALDTMPIDPSFPDFVKFCESLSVKLTVISDGVDYFIRRILGAYQLGYLPIIANQLLITGETSYALSCPHTNPSCLSAAGVCKCRQLGAQKGMRIFVGDGRSDFCAAESADLLFAKSTLAVYCEQKGIPYIPYHTFADVQQALKRALPGIIHREATPQIHAFA
jgi:2,3-diketo-5-methylthio-1-phosphopentane phosphatase